MCISPYRHHIESLSLTYPCWLSPYLSAASYSQYCLALFTKIHYMLTSLMSLLLLSVCSHFQPDQFFLYFTGHFILSPMYSLCLSFHSVNFQVSTEEQTPIPKAREILYFKNTKITPDLPVSCLAVLPWYHSHQKVGANLQLT